MEGILLPICSIIFSVLLFIVYYSKKRVNLIENTMYSIMIVCSVLDSIFVSILQIIAIDGVDQNEIFFIGILNKLDFALLISYVTCIFAYTSLITINNLKNKYKT